jgi:malonyl-CoA O-methyltransferase
VPPRGGAPEDCCILYGEKLITIGNPDTAQDQAYVLDIPRVRRAFDRNAAAYDAAAVLQTEVRDNLLARLDWTALAPRVVLDAGAGTGRASRALARRYPKATVVALDTSQRMLQAARRRPAWLRGYARVRADAALLPLKDGSVDLILSNLMLQWCDLDRVFAEFRRVLAPQGLLTFTTLGPDTLRELRGAWSAADSYTHVNQFIDMHDIGDALVRAGFAAPVLDVERYTLTYVDVRRVAADLRAAGAHNATMGRARGLTGRRRYAEFEKAYEAYRQDGRLPATFEVVYGHAWTPLTATAGRSDGSSVSLEDLRRELSARRRP